VQANGQPLPGWIRFDAAAGRFIVHAPRGVTGELVVKLVARDSKGHEVVTTFKIHVGAKGSGHVGLDASGRLGLSDEIRLAAARGGSGVLERLAAGANGRWNG
jgi:large repetitive protein